MKVRKPGTDQEVDFKVYINNEQCEEYAYVVGTTGPLHIVHCYVPATNGLVTIKGTFSGTVHHGTIDLFANGAMCQSHEIGKKFSSPKYQKNAKVNFDKNTYVVRAQGDGSSGYLDRDVFAGKLQLKLLGENVVADKTLASSGSSFLEPGTIALVVNIASKTGESSHALDFISTDLRNFKVAEPTAILPDCALWIEYDQTDGDAKVSKKRSSDFRKALKGKERYGPETWCMIVFHLRRPQALKDAGCELRSQDAVIELPPWLDGFGTATGSPGVFDLPESLFLPMDPKKEPPKALKPRGTLGGSLFGFDKKLGGSGGSEAFRDLEMDVAEKAKPLSELPKSAPKPPAKGAHKNRQKEDSNGPPKRPTLKHREKASSSNNLSPHAPSSQVEAIQHDRQAARFPTNNDAQDNNSLFGDSDEPHTADPAPVPVEFFDSNGLASDSVFEKALQDELNTVTIPRAQVAPIPQLAPSPKAPTIPEIPFTSSPVESALDVDRLPSSEELHDQILNQGLTTSDLQKWVSERNFKRKNEALVELEKRVEEIAVISIGRYILKEQHPPPKQPKVNYQPPSSQQPQPIHQHRDSHYDALTPPQPTDSPYPNQQHENIQGLTPNSKKRAASMVYEDPPTKKNMIDDAARKAKAESILEEIKRKQEAVQAQYYIEQERKKAKDARRKAKMERKAKEEEERKKKELKEQADQAESELQLEQEKLDAWAAKLQKLQELNEIPSDDEDDIGGDEYDQDGCNQGQDRVQHVQGQAAVQQQRIHYDDDLRAFGEQFGPGSTSDVGKADFNGGSDEEYDFND